MANWFKRNKVSFIVSILGFIVCGLAGYFTSTSLFTLPAFVNYIIGGVCAVLAVVLVMIIGAENAIEFFTRVSVTKLPKEYQDKVVDAIEKIKAEVEAEAEKVAKDKEIADRVAEKYKELVAQQEATLKAKAEQLVKAENKEA